MDVKITQRPELRIAGLRHIGPYHTIGETFRRLGGTLNGPPPVGSQMIAIYLDDPATTEPSQLRSTAGLTLPAAAPSVDGLIEQWVPAGNYAVTVHKGSYEGLPAAWNALKNEWLPATGHRIGNPSYEVYLNNPMTAKAEDLLTEIYLRLE
jgi:AraC family transcriptional regulator